MQRYLSKQERAERVQDASMKRLNSQLKAMIKEGKNALATTIEIDDDRRMSEYGDVESTFDSDEGFVEESWVAPKKASVARMYRATHGG